MKPQKMWMLFDPQDRPNYLTLRYCRKIVLLLSLGMNIGQKLGNLDGDVRKYLLQQL